MVKLKIFLGSLLSIDIVNRIITGLEAYCFNFLLTFIKSK